MIKTKDINIAICGLPSSGKSTLLDAAEDYCKDNGVDANFSYEFAREWIVRNGAPKELSNQMAISMNQYYRNMLKMKEGRMTITECPTFISKAYLEQNYNGSEGFKDAESLHNIYSKAENIDVVLWLNMHSDLEEDGVRYQKKEDLKELEYLMKKNMKEYMRGNSKIITLPNDLDDRKNAIYKIIRGYTENGKR